MGERWCYTVHIYHAISALQPGELSSDINIRAHAWTGQGQMKSSERGGKNRNGGHYSNPSFVFRKKDLHSHLCRCMNTYLQPDARTVHTCMHAMTEDSCKDRTISVCLGGAFFFWSNGLASHKTQERKPNGQWLHPRTRVYRSLSAGWAVEGYYGRRWFSVSYWQQIQIKIGSTKPNNYSQQTLQPDISHLSVPHGRVCLQIIIKRLLLCFGCDL